ncbi:MAG: hypothetical protein AB8C95_00960 [Phycisphaeraceae bacterium]
MLTILSIPVSLVALACWIYTIVVAFQKDSVLMGVLSICPLIGLILGWINHAKWDHTKVMVVWTGCIIVNIFINVIVAVTA